MKIDDRAIPSKLRAHIIAESLRPDKDLFKRSYLLIAWYAFRPLFLVALTVIISLFIAPHPLLLLLIAFPILLAAQRNAQTLVHDLSHKLFSQNIKLNDLLGNYVVGGWIGASITAYRHVHMLHHKYNGSDQDPEHINFNFIRERGGLGLHCLKYILGMEAFRLINKYYELEVPKPTSPEGRVKRKVKHSKIHIFICQCLLFLIFTFIANAWYLYALWLYLAISWNPLLSSLRFLVEHPGESDLTVSTPSGIIERFYFASMNFNFHLEHHLWPNIPPYHLKSTHLYLVNQDYFKRHPEFLCSGYLSLLWSRK